MMIFDRERLKNDMLKFLKGDRIEGSFSTLYLDSVNKITIGVGHLISSKKEFMAMQNFFHSAEDPTVRATPEMMEQEWERMRQLQDDWEKPKPASTYAKGAIVKMDDDKVDEDAKNKIDEKINEMIRCYPTIQFAPYTAQLGLLDIVYNVGEGKRMPNPKKKVKGFPTFNKAINDGDWLTAAKESHRSQVSEIRNKKVAAFFRAAYVTSLKNLAQMCTWNSPKDLASLVAMNDDPLPSYCVKPGLESQYPGGFNFQSFTTP